MHRARFGRVPPAGSGPARCRRRRDRDGERRRARAAAGAVGAPRLDALDRQRERRTELGRKRRLEPLQAPRAREGQRGQPDVDAQTTAERSQSQRLPTTDSPGQRERQRDSITSI